MEHAAIQDDQAKRVSNDITRLERVLRGMVSGTLTIHLLKSVAAFRANQAALLRSAKRMWDFGEWLVVGGMLMDWIIIGVVEVLQWTLDDVERNVDQKYQRALLTVRYLWPWHYSLCLTQEFPSRLWGKDPTVHIPTGEEDGFCAGMLAALGELPLFFFALSATLTSRIEAIGRAKCCLHVWLEMFRVPSWLPPILWRGS